MDKSRIAYPVSVAVKIAIIGKNTEVSAITVLKTAPTIKHDRIVKAILIFGFIFFIP